MPAPTATAVDNATHADLAFARVGARTAGIRLCARTPLKLLTPRHAGEAAWGCLSSHGGGLLNGDDVAIAVEVGAGASAALVTQASTKIYPGRPGSRQTLTATVAAGGLLVAAPDPVVCYKGARYVQRQEFDLARGANLAVVDWLTSGRAACGERWAFDGYDSRLTLRRSGRETLLDATRLDAAAGPLPERLGRFDVIALALATGPRFAAGAKRLLAQIAARPAPRRAPLVISAAPVGEDGVLLRLGAQLFEDAAAELRRAFDFVWRELGDDPWGSRA